MIPHEKGQTGTPDRPIFVGMERTKLKEQNPKERDRRLRFLQCKCDRKRTGIKVLGIYRDGFK
jgi:hypothetical protein